MPDRIDFNCDLGEGCGDDAAIVPHISSASIACGGHAGSDETMQAAVALCLAHGVAIGAHPSFVDREHFGRRELGLGPGAIHVLVLAQVRRLAALCDAAGARLRHVKPHGALYNLAARDIDVADAIAAAVHAIDPTLRLYALSGSALAEAGRLAGLPVAEEAFAERSYGADGRLTPRDLPGAVIEDLEAALAQVRTMLREGVVVALDGSRVPLRADTLCLHGDRPDAPRFAAALRAALEAEGIRVLAPDAAA
ncbi:5-oxoprolinase subunit PxpA [Luteimonas kalidii]|uniref:LamB/YcsF family protein n=1 Tax=Luteimonas kalidii TaxID=3042025 RepID=A0ABT6JTP3_9GAMM|nr:5-oxoprolinase subunit PxpA [Luteimonas kalidii]MDH5834048.1 LamB/YcsF family protein [Luteimonas kalidii]